MLESARRARANGSPTKQNYAQALSLACSYLIIAAGEEVCRRDVQQLRRATTVMPWEALFADELEKRLDAVRRAGAVHRAGAAAVDYG